MSEFKLQEIVSKWKECPDSVSKFLYLERICLQDSFFVHFTQKFLESIEQKKIDVLYNSFKFIFALQAHRQLFKTFFELLMKHPSTLSKLYEIDLLPQLSSGTDMSSNILHVCSFYFHLHIRMFEHPEEWKKWFEEINFVAKYSVFIGHTTKIIESIFTVFLKEMNRVDYQLMGISVFRAVVYQFQILHYFCCNSEETRSLFVKEGDVLYQAWGRMLLLAYYLSISCSTSSAPLPSHELLPVLIQTHPLYKQATSSMPSLYTSQILMDSIFTLLSAVIVFLPNNKFEFSIENIVQEQQLFELIQSSSLKLPSANYIYPIFLLLLFRSSLLDGNGHVLENLQHFSSMPPHFRLLTIYLRSIKMGKTSTPHERFYFEELVFGLHRSEAGSICSYCHKKANRRHPYLMKSADQKRIIEAAEKHGLYYDHVVLPTCSNCKITLYCGKECQRKHWKEHKQQCEGFCNSMK